MMKKYKRIIKGIFILFIAIILSTNVNAAGTKKCPSGFNENAEDDGNGTITASVSKGKFFVYVERRKGENILDANGNQTKQKYERYELTKENPITIKYNKDIMHTVSLIFVYADASCYEDNDDIWGEIEAGNSYSYILDDKTKKYYITDRIFQINPSVSEPLVDNDNYYGICAYLRNETWPDKNSNPDIYKVMKDNIDEDQYRKYSSKIKNSVSACSEKLQYPISPETTAKSISIALKSYVASITTLPDPVIPSNVKKTFDLSTKKGIAAFESGIAEQCSAILPEGYKKGEDYTYTNESIYYAKKKETDSITINNKKTTCEKQCTETLTVKYGPPVATKGGLCFEYQVKVISTVECKTKLNPNPPSTSDYEVCTPKVKCSDKRTKQNDQAGPNEEFDSCIQSCDNGKYTQSCINKCYKQVYGNNQKTKLSYRIKKAANENINEANCKKIVDVSNNYVDIYNCIKQYGNNEDYGFYEYKNGVITWKQGNYHWTRYARYYFSTPELAEQTVNDDYDYGTGTWYGPDGGYHLYAATKEAGDGFKKSFGMIKNGVKYEVSWCSEQCKYVGCDSTNKKLNKNDVSGDYEADVKLYNAFADSCAAEASCSNKTAEFTISVNNKTKDNPDKDNWINYEAAKLTNTGSVVNIADNSNIILDRSDCYGETINKNKYMTEWSFPGTWINVKTSEISYKPQSDKSWTKSERKFCTNLNSANVNEAWWKYGVTKDKSDLPEEFKKFTTEELEKKGLIDLNILATATDFGKFKWKLNVQCFYALKEGSGCDCSDPECDDPECDPTPDSKKKTTISYRVRSVDNSDLFPQTSENSGKKVDTSSAGRTPGFNWTYAARNLKNSNYIIAPDLLISKIQSDGDNVYSKEPDYSFVLDRKALSTIRAYSNENGNNYTRFGGTSKVVNGVLVYESSLFRTVSGVRTSHKLDNSYIDEIGLVGCNNEENKSCYNYSTLVSGIGG